MRGSAVYGFFLGLGALLFLRIAPQPLWSILWWGLVSGHLTWGAALYWRRTGLPFATAAMAIGAGGSAMFAVLAAIGYVLPDIPRVWWAPIGASFLAGPLLFLIESRVHRVTWLRWKQYMKRKSAWDILRGRHIPDLRGGSA